MLPQKRPSSQKIQFAFLPPEIRHQIWTLTLPSRRILDLRRCYDPKKDEYLFRLSHHHPSPTTLQICRDSRAAAFSQGFFFTPNSDQSVYFIPKTDIVCFDSRASTFLEMQDSTPTPGLDRILNVGFDWTHFFCGSYLPGKKQWREVVEHLYVHMPVLKTLNHIPLIPSGMRQRELAIEPLSGSSRFRWMRIRNKEGISRWMVVKRCVETALAGSNCQPEILGWKLSDVDRS